MSLQKIPDHYEEPQADERTAPRDEQQRWEEEHIGAAALRFGARDASQHHPHKDYEYVLEEDEMIQFVSAVQMQGIQQEKVGARTCSPPRGTTWTRGQWRNGRRGLSPYIQDLLMLVCMSQVAGSWTSASIPVPQPSWQRPPNVPFFLPLQGCAPALRGVVGDCGTSRGSRICVPFPSIPNNAAFWRPLPLSCASPGPL